MNIALYLADAPDWTGPLDEFLTVNVDSLDPLEIEDMIADLALPSASPDPQPEERVPMTKTIYTSRDRAPLHHRDQD